MFILAALIMVVVTKDSLLASDCLTTGQLNLNSCKGIAKNKLTSQSRQLQMTSQALVTITALAPVNLLSRGRF